MLHEVLVTFKSGANAILHMTSDMFDTVFNSAADRFFTPAPGYYPAFLDRDSVASAIVIGTVPQAEEEGDEYESFTEESVVWQHQTTEDKGPAATD
jgi:hypothetical protein